MENKELTTHDALVDFCLWAFHSDRYHTFTRAQRHYFKKTLNESARGDCGLRRIKNMLAKHAPGRYEVIEVVVFRRVSG